MPKDDDSRASEEGTFGALLNEIAKPAVSTAPSPPDLIGATLHQYYVVGVLGSGGMGIVYRARDTRLGRQVALKVLPRALSDSEERRRRFLREARSAAAIAHPNIATVYEVGEADGRVFLVMELVDGETLKSKLRDGPLPIPEAVRIGRAIARGLAKAHEKGIIHRDLKPETVMVTLDSHFSCARYIVTSSNRELAPTLRAARVRSAPTIETVKPRAYPIILCDCPSAAYASTRASRGVSVLHARTSGALRRAITKRRPSWSNCSTSDQRPRTRPCQKSERLVRVGAAQPSAGAVDRRRRARQSSRARRRAVASPSGVHWRRPDGSSTASVRAPGSHARR